MVREEVVRRRPAQKTHNSSSGGSSWRWGANMIGCGVGACLQCTNAQHMSVVVSSWSWRTMSGLDSHVGHINITPPMKTQQAIVSYLR